MIRLVSAVAALATSIALLTAAAGHAQGPVGYPAGYYVAVPAAQGGKASLMTRSTPWVLHDGAYVAQRAPERDAVLCALLAKGIGRLSSFTVGGAAYDADALAKCNAKAK